MKMSSSIGNLAKALSQAQSEMGGAIKDSTNPFFKSKYADLESVIEAIREPFKKYELSFIQSTSFDDNKIFIETVIMHSSGEWISGKYPISPQKSDPQSIGSATSYSRRYSLAAMVGVYQTDDDAEIAMNRQNAIYMKDNYGVNNGFDKDTKLSHISGQSPENKPLGQKASSPAQIALLESEMSKNNWYAPEMEEYLASIGLEKDYKKLPQSKFNQVLSHVKATRK